MHVTCSFLFGVDSRPNRLKQSRAGCKDMQFTIHPVYDIPFIVCLFSCKSDFSFLSFRKTSFFITAKLLLLAETLLKFKEPSRFLASLLHDRTSAHDLFMLHFSSVLYSDFLFSFSLLLDSVTVPINPLMNSQTRTRPDFFIIKICRKMQKQKTKNTEYTCLVTSIFW